MVDFKLEQRVYCRIRVFCNRYSCSFAESLQKVYEENALQYGAVPKWVRRFKDGRESVEDDERPGALSQPPPKRKLIL